MTPRIATVAGVGSGVLVALLLLVAFAAFVPAPAGEEPSPNPGTSALPSGAASGGPSAEPTPTPRSSLIVAGFQIGQPAPPLVVPQLGGGEINLANLVGQPVWVNFMATYALSSRAEFALMNDFAGRYADTGLVVIAIDVGEDEDSASAFALETSAAFPIGLDLDGAAQRAWEAPVLPVHFWIDAEGIIRAGATSPVSGDRMAGALQRILPGIEVTPPQPSGEPSPAPSA
ncbi:MAG: TlpA family protein disulfide reductase [Chloroflexi bacterium]|nr:TlpA family protein disulfide reductase [Chloroflexota bacterium]